MEKQPQKQAEEQPELIQTPVYETKPVTEEKAEQLNLFEEHLLKREKKAEYKLIGQVFETYWLVEFENSLYIIDQHAAHERVLYERTLKEMKNREFTAQYLSPPIILSLSMQEAQVLNENIIGLQGSDLRSNRLAERNMQCAPFRTICLESPKKSCCWKCWTI